MIIKIVKLTFKKSYFFSLKFTNLMNTLVGQDQI
jgi:hypothetical protein